VGSILIVEADVATSDAWASALAEAGHAVLQASGAREALAQVREGGIDLVVIDVYDPRAGVVELARAIDALPDAPPIVLISGSPAAPLISARIGAAMFVAKPCEPGELAVALAGLLERLRPSQRSIAHIDDELTIPTRKLG
jgi:two-component system, OmpR family, catabolic regulation response regulator CreB